jgi:transposase
LILNVIDEVSKKTKTKTRGRKPKYNNRYYLQKIVYVLNSDIKWNYLVCEVHYTTVYKVFRKWSQLKVFEIAHNKIIQMINDKHYTDNHNRLDMMLIDSADILNKQGYESVDYTFKYKNKKATRVTIIASEELIPLTSHICAPHIADSQLTKITVDKLPIPTKNCKRRPLNLIADGGYINEKEKIKLQRKVNLIYPYRRNQKKKNTVAEKGLLRKRYKIEHVNAWFKNCKRLTMRVDRLDETFDSFLKLKLLMVTEKRLETLKITIW